jgi:hypothetical protein
MGSPSLIASRGLEDFFYHEVRQAFSNQQIDANPHTEFYLVHLLANFSHRSSSQDPEPQADTPLAIHYLNSLKADPEECIRLLKQLGDFSLYFAGFFQDSLCRKNMDLSYYMKMGGNAYHHIHTLLANSRFRDAFAETFLELASRFSQFVEVFCEISENSSISKNSDLLRLYEKWLSTGSQRILKKLHQFGIFPSSTPPSISPH